MPMPISLPGDNPCLDACSPELLGIEDQAPMIPRTMPAGTICRGMTYARNGVGYATTKDYILEEAETGAGAPLDGGGILFHFDDCGNFSRCYPETAAHVDTTHGRPADAGAHGDLRHSHSGFGASGSHLVGADDGVVTLREPIAPPSGQRADIPEPPHISLPPTALLLCAAVLALVLGRLADRRHSSL
jgi:hypothetical protein